MSLNSLSSETKRLIDISGMGATAAAASVASLTLADWALIATIAAAAFSALWQLMRFYDRFRYGPDVTKGDDE